MAAIDSERYRNEMTKYEKRLMEWTKQQKQNAATIDEKIKTTSTINKYMAPAPTSNTSNKTNVRPWIPAKILPIGHATHATKPKSVS